MLTAFPCYDSDHMSFDSEFAYEISSYELLWMLILKMWWRCLKITPEIVSELTKFKMTPF